MSDTLKGADYRALRRLSNAADETLAEVGETCDHVPPESLAPLLESGHIELAVERRAAAVSDTSSSPAAPGDTHPPRKARK
jgi:hypothetical protein